MDRDLIGGVAAAQGALGEQARGELVQGLQAAVAGAPASADDHQGSRGPDANTADGAMAAVLAKVGGRGTSTLEGQSTWLDEQVAGP